MSTLNTKDLGVEVANHVATVEIRRPPHNFFDIDLIRQIAETYETLDTLADCRAILLCAEGKNFANTIVGLGRELALHAAARGAK